MSYPYFNAAIYRFNTVHFRHVIYIFDTAYFSLKKGNVVRDEDKGEVDNTLPPGRRTGLLPRRGKWRKISGKKISKYKFSQKKFLQIFSKKIFSKKFFPKKFTENFENFFLFFVNKNFPPKTNFKKCIPQKIFTHIFYTYISHSPKFYTYFISYSSI